MAYLDDVEDERAQWTAEDSAEQPEPEATGQVRFQATGLLVLGAILCFTPLLPVGGLLLVMGIGLHLVSPALQSVENNVSTTTRREVSEGTGNGCGAFLWACFVGAVLMLAVGFGAGLVGLVLLHGGK